MQNESMFEEWKTPLIIGAVVVVMAFSAISLSLYKERVLLHDTEHALNACNARYAKIITYSENKIIAIRQTFTEMLAATNLFVYFIDNPEKTARAIASLTTEDIDAGIRDLGRALAENLRQEFVGEKHSFRHCSRDNILCLNENLQAQYTKLDSDMHSLGTLMHTAFENIVKNPKIIKGLLLLDGNTITGKMSYQDRKHVLKLLTHFKKRYAHAKDYQELAGAYSAAKEKPYEKRDEIAKRIKKTYGMQPGEFLYAARILTPYINEWHEIFNMLEKQLAW